MLRIASAENHARSRSLGVSRFLNTGKAGSACSPNCSSAFAAARWIELITLVQQFRQRRYGFRRNCRAYIVRSLHRFTQYSRSV